ncbi:unnamed protein product [Orchesella dallaii]|uniref:EGF-like domain-containing protein n=1 Tax=Orchesella dallaii TaxID=48710 RepID=A0ABP1S4C5_9HEXA
MDKKSKMKDRNFFYGISLIVISHVVVAAQARATYGEPCSRSNRCDSRASLTCNNGTCECLMADVMTFDGTKCAVFAGEKCTFTAVDVQGQGEERSWKEELPCVTNSVCQEGFCTCLPEFYESDNGTCIKKHGFQEECEADLVCRNDQFLVCNEEKKCGCNSTITIFDVSRQLCVTKAGQPCGNGEQCVSNAKCGRKTCTCDADYFQNPKGECETKRGYNEPCEDNSYCKYGNGPKDLQLVCTKDKICGCNANISVYEESRKLCVRLAGETCKDFPKCVKNSVCYEYRSNHVCQCFDEYFSSDGICVFKYDYGKECDLDENCKEGLKCSSAGVCDCDRDELQQFYDVAKGKCVGLAGAHCTNAEQCVVNSVCYDSYYGDCRYKSHCAYSRSTCTCNDGYSKTENQTCLATYGRSCGLEEATACIAEQGTVCKQGKCVCKFDEQQTFDSIKKKCISSLLAPCDETIPCVSNAHCSDQEETFQQCICNDGFVSADGQCLLGIGQQCNYTYNTNNDGSFPNEFASQICDKAAPLQCIQGICQCNVLEEYDYETQKCRGLVGSRCEGRDAEYCTPNSECKTRRATRTNLNKVGLCKCKLGWVRTSTNRCVGEIGIRIFEENQPSDIQADSEIVTSPTQNTAVNSI